VKSLILSDREIRAKLIRDKTAEAMKFWEEGHWEQALLKDGILIEPLIDRLIGPAGYELRVGDEYLSLRDPYNTKKLEERGILTIDPGETVLILTEEYLCLPKTVAAMVVPRARHIFTGLVLNATRVEPTWYGKLVIGITNVGKDPRRLARGHSFCTCQFLQCTEVEKPLNIENTPHLGRRTIGAIDFEGIIPRMPQDPEKVTREDLDRVVQLFGYPWDIVRGAIRRTIDEVIAHITREVAPEISAEAASSAVEAAFKRQNQIMVALVGGLLAILAAVVAYILRVGRFL